MTLLNEVQALQNSEIGEKVSKRLKEFSSFKSKNNSAWFSELCFCILAANAKGENAFRIQKHLEKNNLLDGSEKEIRKVIQFHKHRFHNNKASFIVAAQTHGNVKSKVQKLLTEKNEQEAREWLVNNVKGIGYKEASHFLRNTGCKNLAILDRHIINLMTEHGIIIKPKTLTKKKYLNIERKFLGLAKEVNMAPAELDMYMWYMKTGAVLK